MAIFRYFVSFCTLCVFFLIGYCYCADYDDRFYYGTDSTHRRLEHSLHIELLDDVDEMHNHRKREAKGPVARINISTTLAPAVNAIETQNPSTVLPLNITPKSKATSDSATPVLRNGTEGLPKRIFKEPPIEQPILVHTKPTVNNTIAKTTTDMPVANVDQLFNKLPDDELGVEDEIKESELEKNNITAVKTDTHIFYNSTIFNNPEKTKFFWVNLTNLHEFKMNDLLSNSYRRAATVKLGFDFPFYGGFIKNVTIATGGFLYTGNYVHSWLAATQYIAPLMANFDTTLSDNSVVKYADNGTSFTVEWEKIALQDKPDDEFTFQTTLYKNGDIAFVYQRVPIEIQKIDDRNHPVKVGLSDAYILDRTIFYVRRKTIYEYHRVSFSKEEIKNGTVIYLKALPTCLDFSNCSSCVTSDLNCTWCSTLNQCSTGQDRNRQFWLNQNCDQSNVTDTTKCDFAAQPYAEDKPTRFNNSFNYEVERSGKGEQADRDYIGSEPPRSNDSLGASGYIAIIFLITMFAGFGLWTAYAYKNPHTASGQMLIRYRPSQWRWRRGEARYTAATIHM